MLNDLIHRRAAVWHEMSKLVEAGLDASDDAQRYADMEKDLDGLTARIETLQSHNSRATAFAAVHQPASHEDDFTAYVRHGEVRPSLSRQQSVGVDTAGGFLVPDDFRASIIESLKDFGGARRLAENITTANGHDIQMPTADETAIKGRILAENAAVVTTDLSFGSKTLGAHMYSSDFVKVSRQLLTDSEIDLPSYIGRKLGERIGRIQADHWLTGTDVGQPQGLITGRDTAKDVSTAAAATEPSYDNLIDLVHKPDVAYRNLSGTSFIMHDTVLAEVRKIKDANNLPIWQQGMIPGQPNSLFGYPIVVDNSMPAESDVAATVQVLFGNFRQAYIVRDVSGISMLRLDERFADNLQVAFLAWVRSDGMVKDSGAYAALKNGA